MAFINDTFTNADGTLLPAHDANWEQMPWDNGGSVVSFPPEIVSNHLSGNDGTNQYSNVMRYNVDPGGDEYDIFCTASFEANPVLRRVHTLHARMTPTLTDFSAVDQYVVWLHGGDNIVSIESIVGGAFTVLTSENFTFSDGVASATYDVRLEVRSTGLELFIDDVSILSTGDTTITQRGRVGVSTSRGTASHWVDDLLAETPVSEPVATATAPVTPVEGGTLAVALNGAAADGGGAGGPYTFEWRQISGDTVTLSSASAQNPTFTAPAGSGDLVFGLTVTDSALVESLEDMVTVQVIGPEDTAVPFSDLSVVGWTEVPDDGSPLASSIRDTTNTKYIHSPDNPTGAAPSEFGLSKLNTLQSGDSLTLNYRARFVGGTSGDITVTLKQGVSTVIATRNHIFSEIAGNFETFEDVLTENEIDSITDETDLRVVLEVTST